MLAVSSEMSFPTTRAVMRWILAALFVAAGVAHVAVPDPFASLPVIGWSPN